MARHRPVPAGDIVGFMMLRSIVAQAGVSADELRKVLERMKAMRTYTIVLGPEETGGFMVSVPALPGCFTQGATVEECQERAADAIAAHIAGLEADGEPVPEEQVLRSC